ncbi:MAG: glycosyl transferase family 1 [Flammeovirgaceae bacterium]|nr:glycosyl transferase family 1 [Flammeovirgaceae bacterium]MBE62531.1 glycosyl transferase family 1 [Flammeovirgaceae bacterium]HCX22867.1 glycosyl transferase family 1 [Cytophagales bacterium]|tara:strand:- start:533 stop:1702 length:1170 start_codon:yes stop_codon:yes gene_type:complete
MFTLVDCNNFWSPSGGGVRRYHLEKMDFFKNQSEVKYHFIMHDEKTYSEQIGETSFIEHLRVPKVMGNWEYRYLVRSSPMEPILKQIDPDAIEIGSPYFMPGIVQKIIKKHQLKAKTYGFWHADFPVTYVKRFLDPISSQAGAKGEELAWRHARKYYNQMNGILASSELVIDRMRNNGLQNVHFLPLGVNSQLFHPNMKNQNLIDQYKVGNPNRLLMFFPHRFSKEKGLDLLIDAYPIMCEKLEIEPALVIAGIGPYEKMAREAAEKYEHVHFYGFIDSKEKMAEFYASADLGFALSKWETFGLSLLESMSSGLPLVAANDGAALEHVLRSEAGIVLNEHTPQDLAKSVCDLAKLIAGQDNLRKAARNYAQNLTWENCFLQQLNIYQSS